MDYGEAYLFDPTTAAGPRAALGCRLGGVASMAINWEAPVPFSARP